MLFFPIEPILEIAIEPQLNHIKTMCPTSSRQGSDCWAVEEAVLLPVAGLAPLVADVEAARLSEQGSLALGPFQGAEEPDSHRDLACLQR